MISDLVTGLFTDQVTIDGMVFDAYLEMVQNNTVTVTSHPVQNGANISDHAYENPKEFEYLIGTTNSSMGKSLTNLSISLPIIGSDRAVSAHEFLTDLQKSRKLVVLHNRYGDFDVIITSVSTTDDNTTNDCMKARVHMKEVIIAKTISYTSDIDSFILENNNLGQQSSSPVSSGLYNILG